MVEQKKGNALHKPATGPPPEQREIAVLIEHSSPSLRYVGWSNKGNCGDDAILAGNRLIWRDPRAMGNAGGFQIDATGKEVKRVAGVLLGGGTIIGRTDWLERVTAVLAATPSVPKFAFGVGVVRPLKPGGSRDWTTNSEALKRWVDLLRGFDGVSVRGPGSVQTLADFGLNTTASGDPALLLSSLSGPVLDVRNGRKVLISPGYIESDFYSSQYSPMQGQLEQLVKDLQSESFSITLVAMTKAELHYLKKYKQIFESQVSIHHATGPRVLFGLVKRSCFVISARLHLAVAACASGVPFIGLTHDAKMLDFLEFIDDTTLGVSPNANIRDAFRDAWDRYEEIVENVRTATLRCEQLLINDVRSAREILGAEGR